MARQAFPKGGMEIELLLFIQTFQIRIKEKASENAAC